MSTASLPLSSVPAMSVPAVAMRRKATPQQGAALEMIGHAVEYLVDSRFGFADAEALRILTGASREVFGECQIVVPLGMRIRRRLHLC